MRRRNLVLSGLGAAALVLSTGCDSTVGLDLQANNFREVIAPGACKTRDDASRIDLSVLLLGGDGQLTPDSRLSGAKGIVGQQLDRSSFDFAKAPADAGNMLTSDAVASDPNGNELGLGFQTEGLRYHYSGGEDRALESKLVVLMFDKSGSLIGRDPFSGNVDISKASDNLGERLAFFQGVVNQLPSNYRISLVPFSGEFAEITEMYSLPSLNRDVILEGLEAATRDVAGLTPLARALGSTYDAVISQNLNGLNPVVVLFTDGLEGDDVSGDLDAQIARYETGGLNGEPVPVIIVHLQPPPTVDARFRGRDARLADLACRTGGEYIFLERAEEFTTTSYLRSAVLERIDGAWLLDVQTTFDGAAFNPSAYLVSTQLQVNLAGEQRSFTLQRAPRGDQRDTRLWFVKE